MTDYFSNNSADLTDYFSNNYADRYDSLHRVESPPPRRIVENIEVVCNRIDNLAREHVADDIRWTGVPEWASFYYKKELTEAQGNDDLSNLTDVTNWKTDSSSF
ncbi:hypothetical protein, partial [Haloferax sp. ATB1]|uniref:hypothetical protein n=1 Tax=Haloferax sp. ATB1 TaxID=1508454 RepID=UPI0019D6D1E1